MVEIDKFKDFWIRGRGDVMVVDSKYFDKVQVGGLVKLKGDIWYINGIEATKPLGKEIGLVVRPFNRFGDILNIFKKQLDNIKKEHKTDYRDNSPYWRGVRIGIETCINIIEDIN